MAGISLAICKCSMILAFVSCLHILTAEGRLLKSFGRYHNSPTDHSTEPAAVHDQDDFRPTTPGNSPGVGHSLSKDHDISGTYDLKSSPGIHHSVTGFKDDFRPTDPGNSPGVGHSLPTDGTTKKAAVFGSASEHDSVTGSPDDFRPTDPGHSPGVGHHFLEDDDEPKGSTTNRPLSGFKPTTPGHSPGVGHVLSEDPKSKPEHSAADFKPTNPGHSPGVGHVLSETKTQVTNNKDSVMRATEDFRPTTPGHSPGIGHASHRKNAEPIA